MTRANRSTSRRRTATPPVSHSPRCSPPATAGAANLDAPITKAVRWLKAHQTASGGWGGGVGTEAPNTNSTGLIVQALADAGCADAAMASGTAFLKSAEATAADAGTPLGDQLGAIAYTPAEYQAARTTGIGGLDTWVRASAQAALGLSQIGFHDLTLGHAGAQGPPDPGCSPPGPPPPPPGEKPAPTGDHAVKPPVSPKAAPRRCGPVRRAAPWSSPSMPRRR